MTLEDFKIYKSSNPTMKPNMTLIPVNNFGFNDEGITKFNSIYQYCLELEKQGLIKQFVSTPSGGISIAHENIRGGARYRVVITKSIAELIIRNNDSRYYRFQIGYKKDEQCSITGRTAFRTYVHELAKDGVDISKFAIDNGYEVKQTIPSPKIDVVVSTDRTYYNAHHIDINSAFQAGMMEAFPELEKTVKRIYSKRKENPEFKAILNMTQGFMQSALVNYKYSHISKAGYVWTNNKLEALTQKLINNGYRILGYNTDGIWYQGEQPYHDEDEGTDIGQWKNDHTYCKLRFKSKGAYEFIENEQYHAVVRGSTNLDKIKPRELWQWGDIYQAELEQFIFIEGEGFIKYVNDKI